MVGFDGDVHAMKNPNLHPSFDGLFFFHLLVIALDRESPGFSSRLER